jgi:hypothetical protein
MQRPSLLTASIIAGLGLGLVACSDDPPPPAEVRAAITDDLGNVLREASAAYQGGTESMPGGAASAVVDRMLGSDSEVALRVRSAVARLAPAGSGVNGGSARPLDPAGEPYSPDTQIAYLNEKLFTDANHAGEGIYNVPPSLVCTETSIDASGDIVETIDPVCAEKLARAELRIRVSKDGDQLRFALQVGADHDEPLTLGLEHNAISLTIDLDDAWRAAVALAQVFGEELPNAALAGQITGRLEILGAAHAKATLDIDRAVSIAFAEAGVALDGPDAYRFSSAKAKVLALELDGAGKRGSYALGLGATAAHIFVDSVDTSGTSRDRYELDLPGLTATAVFAAGKPLELTNVSLGARTASIAKNGVRASAIDLNPDDGRALGATIALDPATGRETLTVSPKLDLRMFVDHTVWGDEAPVYDITQILLDGSVRADETGDRLEVVSGSFRLTTNPAGYGFTAAAGQCVAASDVEDLPSGDFYTSWSVGACQ